MRRRGLRTVGALAIVNSLLALLLAPLCVEALRLPAMQSRRQAIGAIGAAIALPVNVAQVPMPPSLSVHTAKTLRAGPACAADPRPITTGL